MDTDGTSTMVVSMTLDPARGAEVERHFREDVLPWARNQKGFVRGQWLSSEGADRGMGVVEFASAAEASAAAQGPLCAPRVDGRAWNTDRVDVFTVLARG